MTEDILREAEEKWACPGDPVYELTPPTFQSQVEQFYEELGSPIVGKESFWDIYLALVEKFETIEVPEMLRSEWAQADQSAFEVQVDLIEGKPVRREEADVDDLFSSGSSNEGGEQNDGDAWDEESLYASFSDDDEAEVEHMVTQMSSSST